MKLILKDLGFGYKGQVLSDFINLEVSDGDYIVILGETAQASRASSEPSWALIRKYRGI